jgi:hypothetical protein
LIHRNDFNSYGSDAALQAAYSDGRNQTYVTRATGRGGTGYAARLSYGPSTPNDIQFGPAPTDLNSIGAWNGTLPEVGGPYDHLYATIRFRSQTGWDPHNLKGFMFWHSGGKRYEFGFSNIRGTPGSVGCPSGSWYGYTIGPAEGDANPCSGRDIFTGDGEVPAWSNYNDGNWHRFTIEIWTDPSGHRGARVWLDGVLTEDFVDNIPSVWYSQYQYPVTNLYLFGNGWSGQPSTNGYLDFDDLIMWTNK